MAGEHYQPDKLLQSLADPKEARVMHFLLSDLKLAVLVGSRVGRAPLALVEVGTGLTNPRFVVPMFRLRILRVHRSHDAGCLQPLNPHCLP